MWILTLGRQGDLDQMNALAKGLGWPTEVKTLDFRRPHIPALAGLLLKRQSDALEAPWPDLAICSEALPSVMARRLKRQSGGRIRIVCVGRPAGNPADFDLVLTTAQYRLAPAANIAELALPLTAGSGDLQRPPIMEDVIRPLIVLVAGGSSFPDRLDAAAAVAMAKAVLASARQQRGTVWAFTSPRTAKDVTETLSRILVAPHRVHVFTGGGANSYRAALAAADRIIVTSDSVSMVSDALATGKPVQVYALPQSRNFQWHLTEWLYRNAVLEPSALFAPVRWLFNAGLIEASADRRLLFKALAAQHRIGWFGEEPVAPQHPAPDDLALAVARVRDLFRPPIPT